MKTQYWANTHFDPNESLHSSYAAVVKLNKPKYNKGAEEMFNNKITFTPSGLSIEEAVYQLNLIDKELLKQPVGEQF